MNTNIFVNEAITSGIENYLNKVNDDDFMTIVIKTLISIYGELDIINPYKTKNESIIIGYFSGSITHDSDIEMIKDALIKILNENKNVKLLLLGELSEPDYLIEFSSQTTKKTFFDWRELPEIISNVEY